MNGFKKALAAIGIAGALGFAGSSGAAIITNTDGNFAWTGFDWAQGGTAFTSNFTGVPGSTFNMTFFSWAVALQNGATTYQPPGMDIDANGAPGGGPGAGTAYEYTVVANFTETFNGCTPAGGVFTCSFTVTGGNYSIYYDTAPNANSGIGGGAATGFTDGTLILAGNIPSQPGGNFTSTDPNLLNGFGIAVLQGTNTFTNTAFVRPAQSGTTAASTLQIGTYYTNGYTPPSSYQGTSLTPRCSSTLLTNCTRVFQADANQSFVPEPATLALIGVGLLGIGYARRRSA